MKDSAASLSLPSSSELSSLSELPEPSSLLSLELLEVAFALACLAVATGTVPQTELAAEFLTLMFWAADGLIGRCCTTPLEDASNPFPGPTTTACV